MGWLQVIALLVAETQHTCWSLLRSATCWLFARSFPILAAAGSHWHKNAMCMPWMMKTCGTPCCKPSCICREHNAWGTCGCSLSRALLLHGSFWCMDGRKQVCGCTSAGKARAEKLLWCSALLHASGGEQGRLRIDHHTCGRTPAAVHIWLSIWWPLFGTAHQQTLCVTAGGRYADTLLAGL